MSDPPLRPLLEPPRPVPLIASPPLPPPTHQSPTDPSIFYQPELGGQFVSAGPSPKPPVEVNRFRDFGSGFKAMGQTTFVEILTPHLAPLLGGETPFNSQFASRPVFEGGHGALHGSLGCDALEAHTLLRGGYAAVAGLRVEVGGWQMLAREAQARATSLEEGNRGLLAERDALQQRLREAEQGLNAHRRYAQALAGEIETLDLEVSKLGRDNSRLRRLAYGQREGDPRLAELEAMLGESRRVGDMAVTRHKELLHQHEELKRAYRNLQRALPFDTRAEAYRKGAWLWESNNRLRFGLGDILRANATAKAPPSQSARLASVIHQLSTNPELMSDAMGYGDLMADAQAEKPFVRSQLQPFGTVPPLNSVSGSAEAPSRLRFRRRSLPSSAAKRHATLLDGLKGCGCLREGLLNSPRLQRCRSATFDRHGSTHWGRDLFTPSISKEPLHQDEWMSIIDGSEDVDSRMQAHIPRVAKSNLQDPKSVGELVAFNGMTSASCDPLPNLPNMIQGDSHEPHPHHEWLLPLKSLTFQAQQLFERLQASEPKILNRKLQRSFHLPSLVHISNTLIQNIQHNVALLPTRFQGLTKKTSSSSPNLQGFAWRVHPSNSEFSFPSPIKPDAQAERFMELVRLVQKLLDEVASLRIQANHLSLAFFWKMQDFSQRSLPYPGPPPSHHWPKCEPPHPPSILQPAPSNPQDPFCSSSSSHHKGKLDLFQPPPCKSGMAWSIITPRYPLPWILHWYYLRCPPFPPILPPQSMPLPHVHMVRSAL
ncbi:hypothetical protein L0F63_007072 [Massospora cicadina]|nr:hypothetical protein L0F63_007072 [Massospora cicadina]